MHDRAYAKVNIFLKIIGMRGEYHELLSRFVRVPSLFDTLWFAPKTSDVPFELHATCGCALEENTLYKAYRVLCEAGYEAPVRGWMQEHALHVDKQIPSGAGLGGGSSDAATFLWMLNESANLGLTCKELMTLGAKVGADVPFFVSGYASANVSGIGERVEPFDEPPLALELFTPPLFCPTGQVYHTYRALFAGEMEPLVAQEMVHTPSDELLTRYSIRRLNDLYAPALVCVPELSHYAKEGWFFSGSGSTFFRMVEHG